MLTVGVRELKEQASKLLRRVREEGEVVEITYHGEVIARLVPAKRPPPSPEDLATAWADIDDLAAEIGAYWPEDVSAVAAVREGRRDL